jgi:hypothetical protein
MQRVVRVHARSRSPDQRNGAPVTVYENADRAAANAEVACISPDGTSFKPGNGASGGGTVEWVAPPLFYKAGCIIALYVDRVPAIEVLL